MGPNQYRDRGFNHFLAVSQENRSLLRGVDELFACGLPLTVKIQEPSHFRF